MPISDDAINALPFGNDAFGDLAYCMQEWRNAGYEAVQALDDPDDSDSDIHWGIALIGNLAWAATVFFPPAFGTVATVSTATKAVSMLGSTLAAGISVKLAEVGGKLTTPKGKQFLDDYLESQVPDLLEEYTRGADEWVRNDLVSHMIAQYLTRFRPNIDQNNDAAFMGFYKSVAGGEERRRYVWENYVFPGSGTPFYNIPDGKGGTTSKGGRGGLKAALAKPLAGALKEFDQLWQKYKRELANYLNSQNPYAGAAYHMGERYIEQHPFNPVLSYKGVPDAFLRLQQSRQRKLSTLMNAKT